jgi:molybdopterin-guanine dinucleotide biosynthesis protein A
MRDQDCERLKIMGHPICGVILAGGKATRMAGQPKGLLPLGDTTLIRQVIKRAAPQVDHLLISSNDPLPEYIQTGLPVIADNKAGHLGPLAGIVTAMEWASKTAPDAEWLVSFAVDTPFFPLDLVNRLQQAAQAKVDIIYPEHGGYRHPTLSLWRISQAPALKQALIDDQLYKMGAWLKRAPSLAVDLNPLPDHSFFNINTPEDLAQAQTDYLEQLI